MLKALKLSVLFLFIMKLSVSAADYRGRVIDKKTSAPLAGANVQLQNTKTGAVTDQDGYFKISVPDKYQQNKLIISYLGYKSITVSLRNLKKNPQIFLTSENFTLDQQIEVYGERLDLAKAEIPHLKAVIDASEIERYGSNEISDLFKMVPAVRIEGNDLDGRHIQIRGSNAQEINLYLDGVLLNAMSLDQTADLSLIPAEAISKLEVLKGSNLPLLGSGAFGGVINIQSKKESITRVSLKSKNGSFDSQTYSAYINIPIFNKMALNYFGQFAKMKPLIEYFPDERFSSKSKNAQIKSSKMNHQLNMNYYAPFGQLGVKFFSYALDYEKPGWQNYRQNYLSSFSINGNQDYTLAVSYLNTKDKVERYVLTNDRNISDYHAQNINIRLSKKISHFQFLTQYLHDELLSEASIKDSVSTRKYFRSELYDNRLGLSTIFSFDDQYDSLKTVTWKTFLALRGDLVASGHQSLTNTLGAEISWKHKHWDFKPYINYGRNVRYPSLLESAYSGELAQITSTDTSYQALEPEYNNSFELGISASWENPGRLYRSFDFNFAYFHNQIYNKILKRPFGDALIQSQIGSNITKGFESSARFNALFQYFNLGASFVKLDIENPLLYEYKPESNLSFNLEFISLQGLYFSTVYFIEGKSYAWYFDQNNELATEKIDPSEDMDIAVGYRFSVSRLKLNIHAAGYNVFDNSGYKYYYLKKRHFQVSLSVEY